MKNKKEQKDSRFAYSDDSGLSILLEKEYVDVFNKKDIKKSEISDIEKAKDKLEGGLADHLSMEQIAKKHKVSVKKIMKQVKKGLKVEREHTDDPDVALQIVKDHISEFYDYYMRLEKMETEAKKDKKEE
jgi:hypothetical protein